MKKQLITSILALGLIASSLISGGSHRVEAAATNYKLTAYNSVGKTVYIQAPKNTVVTKVNAKWYKGTIKFTSYKKVGKKWVKVNKQATAYIPSNKVTTATKWVKKIKSVYDPEFKATDEMKNDYATRYHAWLSDETNHLNADSIYVTIPVGSAMYEQVKGVDKAIFVQNYKGNQVQATSIKEYDTTNIDLDTVYENDNYDVLPTVTGDWVSTEWEDVDYVDYDPSYSYKATAETQAYTKTY